MEWKYLSLEATSILEHLTAMYSDRRRTIEIEIGKAPVVEHGTPQNVGEIVVDRPLFEEIRSWVQGTAEDFAVADMSEEAMTLRLTDFEPSASPSP